MPGKKFIKIELIGLGWGQSAYGQERDYQEVANLLATYLRTTAPLGDRKEARNISVSVCDQVDGIHFLDSDQGILIKV